MAFGRDDLELLTRIVVDAWTQGADRDWSVQAGTLEWTCTATADHAIDTVLAPAFFLAPRKLESYPGFRQFTIGADASPEARGRLGYGLEGSVGGRGRRGP